MSSSRPVARYLSKLSHRASQHATSSRRSTPSSIPRRGLATSPYAVKRQQHFIRSITLVATGTSLLLVYQYVTGRNPLITDSHADSLASTLFSSKQKKEGSSQQNPGEPEKAEIVFEDTIKSEEGASKDENRNIISSQHLQDRKSVV